MKKALALALALLVATPAWADYRHNPYTGKLDYYEKSEEPDLSAYLTSATAATTYLKLDQNTPQIITATETTITASDELYFGDVTDSTKIKKDTVQGILDLVSAPDLSAYSKIDGSTDFTGEPSVKKNFTAGEALTAGNICYLKSDGKFWKARGNAEATTKGRIVMALASISANASGQFLVRGYYTDSGLTAGATYFISTSTAGAKATTAPSSGNFARVVGWAMSTTSFYFDPSKDYIEVA